MHIHGPVFLFFKLFATFTHFSLSLSLTHTHTHLYALTSTYANSSRAHNPLLTHKHMCCLRYSTESGVIVLASFQGNVTWKLFAFASSLMTFGDKSELPFLLNMWQFGKKMKTILALRHKILFLSENIFQFFFFVGFCI